MTIDISCNLFDHRKNYSSLISEQGRVQLDSDWNDATAIADRRWRAETLDIFGRCRVPRETPDAFRIAIVNGGLTIGLGRMYVDGLLAENHGEPTDRFDPALAELTGSVALPFGQQPFLIQPNTNDLTDGRYLVYLDVWCRDVTAIEDPDLIEKAVGIPTTSRRQTVWQVKIHDEELGVDVFCSTPDENIPGWLDLILPSDGRLSAQAMGIPSIEDPCLLPPSGGYRGLENRLYRVEIQRVEDNGNATFKWSRHNATVTTSVNAIPSNNALNVESIGRDSVLRFSDGDWIEIIDDALEFSNQAGIIRRISTVNDTSGTITLTEPLPNNLFPTIDADGNLNPKRHTRARRWDQSGEIRDTNNNLIVDLNADDSIGVIPVPTPGTSIVLEDGVQITFDDFARPDGRYRTGDFWFFPTRIVDASVEELDHEPPCGIHHHYCRLALVDVVNNEFTAIVGDCRVVTPEDPGVRLGCCSVTVSLNESIQAAINSLPVQGGKICLLPGEYRENLRIRNRRNITLMGCGSRTRIISIAPDEDSGEADPVIDIINSAEIRIESLAVEAHTTGVGILVEETRVDDNGRRMLQVENILLQDLYITAAIRSGIEIRAGSDIIIRGCLVEMQSVRGTWPGIFLIAQEALIENNEIQVLPPQIIGTSNRIIAGSGRGGLQIGGTSEQVRVKNNLIRNGIGNGITLGCLEEVDDRGFLIDPVIAWRPFRVNVPCEDCDPINPRIPPFFTADSGDGGNDDDDARIFRSAGSLYDIAIEYNRIYDMDLNGIGVAGFFDLSVIDEFITVNGLTICNNDIQRCLSRPLAPIDTDMIDSMGYGGIALADVENLVICHNKIENNGPSFMEPICGIFILHVEGVDISDNRIVNNGAKTVTRETPKQGRRGGINIVYAISPTMFTRIGSAQEATILADSGSAFPRQNGVPAVKIHDNIISQPLGRALDVTALGPVSVVNNQLTTLGIMPSSRQFSQSVIGSTALIMNLGISNELYGQLLNFSGIVSGEIGSFAAPNIENGAIIRSQEGLDDLNIGQYLANGNILFSCNQCVLDLLETGLSLAHSSVALFSLDDIGFNNNQCDCNLFDDFVYFNLFVFAPSIRVGDNRFKEGIYNAMFSAATIGNMNVTTNNQATHCLLVSSVFPNSKVDSGNQVLMNEFVQGYCQSNRDALNATSFRLRGTV